MQFEKGVQDSVNHLASDEALVRLSRNSYWPKWNSTWWHMRLLSELGHANLIPKTVVDKFVEVVNGFPLKIFPIRKEELPKGIDSYDTFCHCQIGTYFQVLAACGVDIDAKLPWMREWILKYQMADGGFNCDNDAYLVEGECPSSMVATVPVFEAILFCTPREWTKSEVEFLDRAADFLMNRKLIEGSATRHNADERTEALLWAKPIFPRFYFYDTLRGLKALLIWAEKRNKEIDPECIREAVAQLQAQFPDDLVKVGRRCYAEKKTRVEQESGEWTKGHPVSFFPLLNQVGVVGQSVDVLCREWEEVKRKFGGRMSIATLPTS